MSVSKCLLSLLEELKEAYFNFPFHNHKEQQNWVILYQDTWRREIQLLRAKDEAGRDTSCPSSPPFHTWGHAHCLLVQHSLIWECVSGDGWWVGATTRTWVTCIHQDFFWNKPEESGWVLACHLNQMHIVHQSQWLHLVTRINTFPASSPLLNISDPG